MFFRRRTLNLRPEVQTVIRIKIPWYEPFDVETKYYGTFKIQLSSISVEGTTVIQIAGHPVKTKHTPKNVERKICGLSGAFETQEQAIQGWENGFVVLTEGAEHTAIAEALVKNMINRRQAEVLQVSGEAA